jgi:hypothetical protein
VGLSDPALDELAMPDDEGPEWDELFREGDERKRTPLDGGGFSWLWCPFSVPVSRVGV